MSHSVAKEAKAAAKAGAEKPQARSVRRILPATRPHAAMLNYVSRPARRLALVFGLFVGFLIFRRSSPGSGRGATAVGPVEVLNSTLGVSDFLFLVIVVFPCPLPFPVRHVFTAAYQYLPKIGALLR